jgi:hypothetical protein
MIKKILGVGWTELAQVKVKWWVSVKTKIVSRSIKVSNILNFRRVMFV